MATLVLTAVGSLFGPLGGAIGAVIGRQIDSRILGPSGAKGPRLKELSVTTSSYGQVIPRHYGRMRVGGSIIWSTDLVERREKSGGGKGRPKVTTYAYSVSFAVALSSRPVLSVGRIWADGNLLRGAAGDMKTGGTFRLHQGLRDQAPDPLIAAAEGVGQCPAFRGLAYGVFEDLELGDFGNRIPALTFEVIAGTGEVSLLHVVRDAIDRADADVPLSGLAGLSVEGSLADTVAMLEAAYPLDCDASAEALVFRPERLQASPVALDEPAIAVADGDFGGNQGRRRQVRAAPAQRPAALRYYDLDRDYQPGLQRAPGRTLPGETGVIDLPGALSAQAARSLAEGMARADISARQTLSWRTATLDPAVRPGALVTVPGEAGVWRVREWEWRDSGVELALHRLPAHAAATGTASDPGRANLPADLTLAPTVLTAFELPWDGLGQGDAPAIFAALSSSGGGWAGAALFADQGDGELVSLGPSGRTRAIMGTTLTALPERSAHLFDRESVVEVDLADPAFTLPTATPRQLAQGASRALIG
ncbi:MAG TPA: phage tail protein, partial [Novosphingobium sp.]|nr:phage tail protein [Novosphingobium sp.]